MWAAAVRVVVGSSTRLVFDTRSMTHGRRRWEPLTLPHFG
jgi:hypothetical protein